MTFITEEKWKKSENVRKSEKKMTKEMKDVLPSERGSSIYSRKFISRHGYQFRRNNYDRMIRGFRFGEKKKRNVELKASISVFKIAFLFYTFWHC